MSSSGQPSVVKRVDVYPAVGMKQRLVFTVDVYLDVAIKQMYACEVLRPYGLVS